MEYKEPIRINPNDPICSATTLGDTVIGVLFEKTGEEIKGAIKARLDTVDSKVAEYEGAIAKVNDFIKEKKAVLKSIDEFYATRREERNALAKPFQREIDEIRKEKDEAISKIYKKKNKQEEDFNQGTLDEVECKARIFEKSFDSFKDSFSALDALLNPEEGASFYSPQFDPERLIEPVRGYGEEVKGLQGSTGIPGNTGVQGVNIYHSDNSGTTWVNNTNNCGTYTVTSNGSIGISSTTPSSFLSVQQEKDRAMARMDTLRSLLREYGDKVSDIQEKIEELMEERRRLQLIYNNVIVDRRYKLDLNKLSAFGFEDVK